MKRLVILLIATSFAMACDPSAAEADAAMCDATLGLVRAKSLTQAARVKDASGDRAGAEELATLGGSAAEAASDRLLSIDSSEIRQGATWLALLGAYAHVAQGANALLPEYENAYGSTDSELAAATAELTTAAQSIPANCFNVIETDPAQAP